MRGGEATSVPISKDTKRFNAQEQKGHWNYHNPFQISDQQAQNPKFPTFDWTGIIFFIIKIDAREKENPPRGMESRRLRERSDWDCNLEILSSGFGGKYVSLRM